MANQARSLLLLGLLTLGHAIQCPRQKTSPGREIVCYTSVTDVELLADSICRCTTLVHQGHDARNLSTSDLQDFQKSLKQINPPLQFVLSIDDAGRVLDDSNTARQEATARIIRTLKEVDGVELNVTLGTKDRLLSFVKGLKDELVRKSYDKRIFLVLSTKPGDLAKQFDLKELSKYVDLFTVATHYLVDKDEAYHTFHPSRLMGLFDMINTDSLIDLISGLGAPKRKILVSVPASAYRFTLKDEGDNAPRAPTVEREPVVIGRKQLCDSMNDGEWTIERDEDLTAPYAFKNTTWTAFEDNISAGIKGKYALVRDLPGLAIREIENDHKTKCGKSLTHEIHHSFTDFKRKTRAAVLDALEDELHQSQITYPTRVKSSNYRVVRVVDTEGHIRAVRENTQTEFTCSRQGYFVHPKSCNRFYRCVKFNQEVEDYSVFEFDCPAGLAFDERTEVCVWPGSLPQGSPCPGSSEIAPEPRMRFVCPAKTGYYADPQNPRWFFACMDLGGPELMAFEFRCPYELIFDESKLACEWPWLVEGHSDTGYNLYNSGTYGQGAGGYYTGGLPSGFSPSTGANSHGSFGGFAASTQGFGQGQSANGYGDHRGSGIGVTTGSGFSGGSDYSGSAGAGHGGSFGYTGSTGSSGYTGSTGSSGYRGSTGSSGYTGSVGSSGYTGSTGSSGYRGSTGSSGYTGSAGGSGYTGAIGSSGYTGSAGGSGYAGSAGSSGYTGSAGAGAGHYGGADNEYSGSAGATSGVQSGISTGGYTGSVAGAGSTSAGAGYSGSTGGGFATGDVHQGSVYGSTGLSGSTDNKYTQQGSGGYTVSTDAGSFGGGFTTGGVHQGSNYGSTGLTGSTGSKYTGHGSGGYTVSTDAGSFGGGFTTGGVHQGSVYGSTDLSGSTDGKYTGHGSGGYTASTGAGSSGGYSGSTSGSYFGSTSQSAGGKDVYSGSIGGSAGYSTSAGASPSGSSGSTYQGPISGVYTGTTSHGGTVVTGHVSGPGFVSQSTGGAGYAGSTSKQYQGSAGSTHGGSIGTTYTGSSAGEYSSQPGYSVSTNQVYTGSSKYDGVTGGSYIGSTGGGYSAVTGGSSSQFSDQTKGYSAAGYDQTYTTKTGGGYETVSGYPGSSATATIGASGASSTGYTDKFGSTFDGSSGTTQAGYSGTKQTGTSKKGYTQYVEEGYTIPVAIGAFPIYPVDDGSQDQTIGVAIINEEQPGIGYRPSTTGFGVHAQTDSSSTVKGQTITAGHGASLYPGQAGSTFPGTTGGTQFGTSGATYIGPGSGRPKSDLNVTVLASGGPLAGTTYHPGSVTTGLTGGYGVQGGTQGTGAIITGSSVEGSITTGDFTSGSVIAHGDTSGTVLTGFTEQGSIVIGGGRPGYTNTGASTPGYVINGGTKTVYTDSGSPGVTIHGAASPGVVVTGSPTSGTVLGGQTGSGVIVTGQTAPGVSIGGSVYPGTVVGTAGTRYTSDSGYSTYHGAGRTDTTGTKTYSGTSKTSTVGQSTGYKTNEYYDNGGRGTIKFNNGYETTKYAENDIPDYHPAGITIPVGILAEGGPESGIGAGPTIAPTLSVQTATPTYPSQRPGSPTPTGFTRPTLAGHGGYTISTGRQRPTPNYDNIGEKAFEGNVAGYTKSSTETSVSGTTKSTSDYGFDGSRITQSSSSSGYSYPKPSIKFETGSAISTERTVPAVTTPTPFLSVELYNTPSVLDSAPITATPAVVNTYTFGKSTDQYQGTSGRVPSGFSTTPSTVTYTRGPVDSYKSTLFEAAKIPVAVSTLQPALDTGYKTVESPVTIPVAIAEDKYGGSFQGSLSTQSKSDLGFGTSFQETTFGTRKDYASISTPSTGAGGYSSTKSRRPFGPAYTVPSSTYVPQTVTGEPETNYVYSTPSSGSSYSYTGSKTFGEGTTPSSAPTYSRPQSQYLPTGSVSSEAGVTYTKPGITYQGSTLGSTLKPGLQPQGFSRPSTGSFGVSYTEQGYSSQGQTGSSYESTVGTGGSPTNVEIDRDQVGKLITNYDRGTMRYTPSVYDTYTGSEFTGTTASLLDHSGKTSSSSSSFSGTYGSSTPFTRTERPLTVTTYSGGYSRPSSVTSSYEVTTKPTTVQPRGKVIVKWSDLHPLLLGKLGAECTCRADPYANLRGPARKLIDSSRGKVDLSNYDESEIYVDLEREGSYEDGDYVTNYESSSQAPVKMMNVNRQFKNLLDSSSSSGSTESRGRPTSTYLPASSTGRPSIGSSSFLLSGLTASASVPGPSYTSGHRTGKNLNYPESNPNLVNGKGASFDRYGPGGLRDSEEILEGVNDCARPGLFRHPNFCNKFYACHWDEWKKKFTLHVFNCPVHLTFDSNASACNWPSKGPACQDDNLLV